LRGGLNTKVCRPSASGPFARGAASSSGLLDRGGDRLFDERACRQARALTTRSACWPAWREIDRVDGWIRMSSTRVVERPREWRSVT
jgi:hypothetical protein